MFHDFTERFAFDLYDEDNSGVIDISEAQLMVKDVYGKQFERNPRAKSVYQKLSELKTPHMTFRGFQAFARTHKAMLYPAYSFQLNLKKYIMGKSFWKKQAKNRIKMCKGTYKSIDEILGPDFFPQKKME